MFKMQIVTDTEALSRQIQEEIDKEVVKHLSDVLERGVELVRNKITSDKAYEDHTGNLRSSTGYIIIRDGRVVHKSFKESPGGTDKQTGLKTGLKVALDELRESTGWGVILVSGMEYASWVQSRGYDVLKGAYLGLDSMLEQAFNELGTFN